MPEIRSLKLVAILADTLTHALASTSDRWIRAEIPSDWPVRDALFNVQAQLPSLRVGVLHPFALSDLPDDVITSNDAKTITDWRNQSIDAKRQNPTIVVGETRGTNESGLRSVPRIITEVDVVRTWHDRVQDWLRANVNSQTPTALFAYLFDLASDGLLDAVNLDEYITFTFEQDAHILTALRNDLWRINLFPDNRVLDSGNTRARIELNMHARRLLLSASVSPSDIKQVQRLRQSAAHGNEVASRAVLYSSTKDRILLQNVQLDTFLELLTPHSTTVPVGSGPKQPTPRRIGLFEFLDHTAGLNSDQVLDVISRLGEGWNLDNEEVVNLVAVFTKPGDAPLDVHVEVSPVNGKIQYWVKSGEPKNQVLALQVKADAQRDWVSSLPQGRTFTGAELQARAATQDNAVNETRFVALVDEYLAARARLQQYEPWMRYSTFMLLLLKPEAREDVRQFLFAWQALVNEANDAPSGRADIIRPILVYLEAIWGGDARGTTHDWCVLSPFHPYLLDPWLRLADYTLSVLGSRALGKKVSWALDRSLPAYRVIWQPNETFFLTRQTPVFEFQTTPSSNHSPASEGDGIYEVVRSFVGFHPFAKDALVVTLINPPKGGAVSKNIQRVAREVGHLRVYLVTTRGDTARLDEAGEYLRDLGRFQTIEDWLHRSPVQSHLVFYFAERQADSTYTAGAAWGPTPGAHVALQINLQAQSAFDLQLAPFVSFEPRQNNNPVIALQRLALPNQGSPKLFQVQPMLQDDVSSQFQQLSDVGDWIIIAAPSPLGLIAPRKLGDELKYLGRETLGSYGLFVYATSLFPIRKLVTQQLAPTPVAPDPNQVESQLAELAVRSPNGVLRIGRGAARQGDNTMWEQIGIIISSSLGRSID